MPPIQIITFGQFTTLTTSDNGGPIHFPTNRTQALLAYLLAHPGQPQRRDYLASFIWQDRPDKIARRNLRKTLSRLRKATAPHAILQSDRKTAQLNVDLLQCDVWQFDALVGRAETAVSPAHLPLLEQAADLYQGPFLHGFYLEENPLFEEWLLLEQETWQQKIRQTLTALINAHEQAGAYEKVIRYAEQYITIEPWHEATRRCLLRALAELGRAPEAAAHYQKYTAALQTTLGIPPEAETARLVQQMQTKPADDAAPPSISAEPATAVWHGFPNELTTFVGRAAEIARIQQALMETETRLLTITGEGGMGKTRAAIQAAARLAPDVFPTGIYFIPCTAITSPADFFPHLAAHLHHQLDGEEAPWEQTRRFLGHRPILLLLDNFEQLSPHAVDLLTPLLRETAVTLLVTSRHALNLQEEWRFSLGGLDAAADLFMVRARRYGVQAFTPAERDQIDQIVALVQGMPLAIEMAAAWLRAYDLSTLVQFLQDNLDMWVAAPANVPERHRSLEAVFDGSWRLLPDRLRPVFAQLSLLYPPFTAAAAQHIARASFFDLAQLVDRSLLQVERNGRYQIHPLLRRLAQAKLPAVGDGETAVRHADYYLRLLQRESVPLRGRNSRAALRMLQTDFDNIRAAWQWAVNHRDHPQAAALITNAAAPLADYFLLNGFYGEGATLLQDVAPLAAADLLIEKGESTAVIDVARQILAHDPSPATAVHARTLLGRAYYHKGQLDKMETTLTAASTLVPQLDDVHPIADLWVQQAQLCILTGRPRQARSLLAKATDIYENCSDLWGASRALLTLAQVAAMTHEDARPYFLDILAIQKQIGSPFIQQGTLKSLAMGSMFRGDYPAALDHCREALGICRRMGNPRAIAKNRVVWGRIQQRIGQYDAAAAAYAEAKAIFQEHNLMQPLTFCLIYEALLAHQQGQYRQALHCSQQARRRERRLQNPLLGSLIDRIEARAHGELGQWEQAHRQAETALQVQLRLKRPGRVMNTRGVLARILSRQGQMTAALEHVDLILDYLEITRLHKAEDPLYMEWCCYQALREAGDDRATPLLNELYATVKEQARRLEEAKVAHQLWSVPHHRALRREAAK